MTTTLYPYLLIAATLGSGVMAGLFFVFSNFVMQALGKLPPNTGAVAMQNINVTIINPWFMTFFMGTALSSLAAIILATLDWERPGSAWAVAGGVLYLVGCMFITMRVNVPLNNELAALDPELSENFPKWESYLASWLPWNHVRTFTTLASTAAFVIAVTNLGLQL